jgi:hypothetical protein
MLMAVSESDWLLPGLDSIPFPGAWSRKFMAEFVTIPTIGGEIADVNLDMITHMRPNPANKDQIIIHFVGGHTLLVPGDRRKVLVNPRPQSRALET